MLLKPSKTLEINEKTIGDDYPTYFIADIAANHDGDLVRAKELIYLAAESGADAAKFQHFSAETIVSSHGFQSLESQQSHQSKWEKSVYEVYNAASVDLEWTTTLQKTCQDAGIAFFTSPYSKKLVDFIDDYVPAHKIGSGDITWLDMIRHIAAKGKPTIIASGASTCDEVASAIAEALKVNSKICLLQCNTNYTADIENFNHIQLNVLKTYRNMFPSMVLGLSDHTPGHATVLGAVALGARIIEKHLTDDNLRNGPDHKFAMNGRTWFEMVQRTRELEKALGNGIKRIEENERETVIVQRRSLCASQTLKPGTVLSESDITVLRPCPADALVPTMSKYLVGKKVKRIIEKSEIIRWMDVY